MLDSRKYRIMALVLQIKKSDVNARHRYTESLQEWHSRLNNKISLSAFKKYIHLLRTQYNCFKSEKTNEQLKSNAEILEALGIELAHDWINRFTKSITIEDSNKDISDKLIKWLIIGHFKAQKHKIEKTDYNGLTTLLQGAQSVKDRTISGQQMKLIKRETNKAKKAGISTEKQIKRTLAGNQDIVTGCKYLGKKLNISHQKANTLLNELVNENKIERAIVSRFKKCKPTHGMFDSLKENFKGMVIPVSGRFVMSLGSIVNLL